MMRERFFETLLAHRWVVLSVLAVGVAGAAYGGRRVRIDYGVEQFFLSRGPERATYDEFKSLFPREDTRVSLFWEDSRGPSVGLFRDLQRVAAWFEDVGLDDVRWLGNVTVAEQEMIEGETGITVGPLIPPETDADSAIAGVLAKHRSDRLLDGVLWDATQTVFLVHGYIPARENTDPARRRIDAALNDSLSAIVAPGARLVLTGLPIARARAPKLLEADMRLLLSSAFVLFFLILYWYFRDAGHVVLSIASVIPAYLCTLGLLGAIGKPISILTSFIPIVVLVVGMCDAVHILSEYRGRRGRGEGRHSAIVGTFAALAGPCFYTSVTTAAGFACLAGTGIGIVVDFGVFTAAAILLTFVFSMTAFPIMLSAVPERAGGGGGRDARWLTAIVDVAARRAQSPSRRTVAVSGVVAGIAAVCAAQLRVDTYLIDDTKESAPFMRDIRWIGDRGFGFFQVNVLLKQTGDRPLHDPVSLAWMDELASFARTEPLVTHVAALPDFLAHLRRATLGPQAGPLPASSEEASQLLLVAAFQDPAFVEDVYREAQGAAQVILTVRDEGSQVLEPFLVRLNGYLAQHPYPVGTVEVTGTVTMIHEFTGRLLESFGPSILVGVTVITLIMMRMLRSVRFGLLALLPNLFPLVVLLGAMSVLGFSLKPSTILVLSIAFGIAVDDTIHLLSRVQRHQRRDGGVATGLTTGLREAGSVMVVTTSIVTAGFLLLTASHFQVLFLIGLMTAVSAVSALAADLFVLPSLVHFAQPWRRAVRHQWLKEV